MNNETSPPAPPATGKRPVEDTRHGITRTDNYAWLRADNWQEVMRDPSVLAPDIRTVLEAENSYTAAIMAETDKLQETLFAEMKGRIKEDDSSVPAPDGPFAYFTRYVTGGQHPLFCRRLREGDEHQVLIDANALAEPHAYFRIGGVSHSPDHKLVAYSSDTNGSEYYAMHVLKIETGDEIGVPIPDTAGGAVWANDSKTLFYSRLDENHRPRQIFRHTLGTEPDQDVLIYEEADPGFFVGVGMTQSRAFIVIDAHDHQTSEIRIIDANAPGSEPRLISARDVGHEYSVEHQDDKFIICTNVDGAEDFKIVEAPVDAPDRENWREIEPHKQGRLILDVVPYKDHLIRLEREDGLPRIVVRQTSDGSEHAIAFEEDAYALGLSSGYEYDTTTVRFTYSSMTTPAQVFDYDVQSRDRTLRKTQEVPSGHNPDDYVTRRIMAPAHDDETIPVTLLYRKTTPLNGDAPLLLYGYGAYGISIPAGFNTNCLSLADRGFIFAIAHIRGGKEKGYRWYREGRGASKTNTFKDFVSAGEHLARENFTSRGKIVAHGGSAGGMLMGAVANMAPDLFAGVIAEVPFVDVLNTMLDDTLPLTPPEWPEWGNPIEDKEAYEVIAAYSPYDNVTSQSYPNILALAGLTDPRVTYWEPAKWIAKLRALKTNDPILMLKTNMDAGHGGASGRFDRLKEVAIAYAFALKVTGKLECAN
ncbi:MAG: S9 family peptidase [Hyphomicrobiaceae bacterium]|nr:S9 family peptidase [Hyphomicrobiaceae bacterium]